MIKPRKVPQRMCVGCREKGNKRDLIRVVRSPDHVVTLDPTGKKPGRGAYVCRQRKCLQQALKTKSLERALNTSLSEETISQLLEQI